MNSHSLNQQGLKGKDIQDILIWFRNGFWWSPWIFRGLFLILLQDYLPFQTVRESYMLTVVLLEYNRFPKQFTLKSHNRNTIDSHKIVSWWFMGYFWNAQFLFPRIWVPSSISGTVRFWISPRRRSSSLSGVIFSVQRGLAHKSISPALFSLQCGHAVRWFTYLSQCGYQTRISLCPARSLQNWNPSKPITHSHLFSNPKPEPFKTHLALLFRHGRPSKDPTLQVPFHLCNPPFHCHCFGRGILSVRLSDANLCAQHDLHREVCPTQSPSEEGQEGDDERRIEKGYSSHFRKIRNSLWRKIENSAGISLWLPERSQLQQFAKLRPSIVS